MADISPGDTVFITFQAQILAIPPSGTLTNNALVNYEYTVNPNQSPAVNSTITNTTVTPIIDATLSINKTVNSTFATIGDTLTFTSTITNSGNTTANNVIFTDVIPNGTTFIPNSFTVNGTTITNANPQNGINIGNLNSNASATLSFQVNITTLPNPNPIPNKSSLQYSFIVDINEPPVSRTVQSNKTFTQVNTASVIATKLQAVLLLLLEIQLRIQLSSPIAEILQQTHLFLSIYYHLNFHSFLIAYKLIQSHNLDLDQIAESL